VSAANRFHLFVSGLTIACMTWILIKLLECFPNYTQGNYIVKMTIGFFVSAGFYKLLATFYRFVLNRSELARRFTYGPDYVDGTWVGRYTAGSETRLTVEHFEQTLDGLVVRGYAFTQSDSTPVSDWTSKAATINASRGELTFSYNCNHTKDNTTFQGLADFKFERHHPTKPPQILEGYSADLNSHLGRFPNRERLLSRKQAPLPEAWAEAKK
jgi:hypothetical protein